MADTTRLAIVIETGAEDSERSTLIGALTVMSFSEETGQEIVSTEVIIDRTNKH